MKKNESLLLEIQNCERKIIFYKERLYIYKKTNQIYLINSSEKEITNDKLKLKN